MPSAILASTPKGELDALAYKGILASASYPQIRDMLARNLGGDFALLFAKPVENPRSGVIDWLSPVPGEAKKLAELPQEEREAALARLGAMGQEINNLADSLIESQDPLKATRGNILKLALSFPSENDIFAVGGQPVLTCWGFAPGKAGVEPMNLWRSFAPAPKPAPKPEPAPAPAPGIAPAKEAETEAAAPPPAPPRRGMGGCLWMALPLLPLALLLFLLFTSFGFIPALSGAPLLHLPFPELPGDGSDAMAKARGLEAELEGLKGRVHEHAALCKPEPKPEPAAQAAPGALEIPEDATDASFMEGRWLCRTGLANSRTGEAVQMTFSFGKDGKGEAVVIEQDDQCAGQAEATFQNHALHIDIGDLLCQKENKAYNPMAIVCDNADGSSTRCHGLNENGTKWDAVFIKLR